MATNDANKQQLLKLPSLRRPPKQQQVRQKSVDVVSAQECSESIAAFKYRSQEPKYIQKKFLNGATTSTRSDGLEYEHDSAIMFRNGSVLEANMPTTRIVHRKSVYDFEFIDSNKENLQGDDKHQSAAVKSSKRKMVHDENDSHNEKQQSKRQPFLNSQRERDILPMINQHETKYNIPDRQREQSDDRTLKKPLVVDSIRLRGSNFDDRQKNRPISQLLMHHVGLKEQNDGINKIQSTDNSRTCNTITTDKASLFNEGMKNDCNDRKDKSFETDESSNMSVSMEELENDYEHEAVSAETTVPKGHTEALVPTLVPFGDVVNIHDSLLVPPVLYSEKLATSSGSKLKSAEQKVIDLSSSSSLVVHQSSARPQTVSDSKTENVANSSEHSFPQSIPTNSIESSNTRPPILARNSPSELLPEHGWTVAGTRKPPLLGLKSLNQRHGTKPSRLLPIHGVRFTNQSMMKNVSVVPNLGLPQRADPNQSIDDLNDDDSIEDNFCTSSVNPEGSHQPEVGTNVKAEVKSTQIAAVANRHVKITKTDLTYMWQWDPDRRSNSTDNRTKQKTEYVDGFKANVVIPAAPFAPADTMTSETASKSQDPVILETIEPTDSSGGNCNSKNHNGTTSNSPLGVKAVLPHSHEKETSLQNPSIQENNDISKRLDQNNQSTASISKVNRSFVRLVSENNMIWVNGISYAKLGVLGKGGSCKVYRALSSKDYSTVAIKKVKIDGMDKKAIEGYSNEIQLLKRLRGNPSIIQLQDSEVDTIQRQAIFLVMEVGEVDLNHVLQKQTLEMQPQDQSGSSIVRESHGGQLNLNFIRLTWQQMLTAVHSMHEERIIHGDLKPANFLFVRGALKLIDFGIAKAIQSDDTTNIYRESHIGTLNYMSPESLLADCNTSNDSKRMKCGRPSDIWSLGCILYQMIYGKTPFYDLHTFEKMKAIANPNYKIAYPTTICTSTSSSKVFDPLAVDAIQQCLRWKASDRAPIVGIHGLLNEHRFLNSSS